MMIQGDEVTVKPPFDSACPGIFVIAKVVGSVCTLLINGSPSDFDVSYLQPTGNTGPIPILPVDVVSPRPIVEVTNAQGRVAIIAAGNGLFAAIDAAANAAGPTSEFYTAWHYAPTWKSDSTLVASLKASFGLSDDQAYSLWEAASQVVF